MQYFDQKETRSQDERVQDYNTQIPKLIRYVFDHSLAYQAKYQGITIEDIQSVEDFIKLPVLRKSDIGKLQAEKRPFGGLETCPSTSFNYIFQSPGPLYEPGNFVGDWWRIGRFLFACGIGKDDIVQNCFSYHLTPAGHIFESGARAVGATVIPAGTGNTELQVKVAHDIGTTAYAGTPDYLNVILEKADELGIELSSIKKAGVSGGPLFPSMRKSYEDRGILCLQTYATAELGNIGYETIPDEGLIIDEDVIVEILTPGSDQPVLQGEIGEVVVTSLKFDFPLIRFATGDLSSILPGISSCGRTNQRLSGWKGRADQTTKVKGLFVRPEQFASFIKKHPEVSKIRAVVSRASKKDTLTVKVETEGMDRSIYQSSLHEILRLGVDVELVTKGSLPCDGVIIEDLRKFD